MLLRHSLLAGALAARLQPQLSAVASPPARLHVAARPQPQLLVVAGLPASLPVTTRPLSAVTSPPASQRIAAQPQSSLSAASQPARHHPAALGRDKPSGQPTYCSPVAAPSLSRGGPAGQPGHRHPAALGRNEPSGQSTCHSPAAAPSLGCDDPGSPPALPASPIATPCTSPASCKLPANVTAAPGQRRDRHTIVLDLTMDPDNSSDALLLTMPPTLPPGPPPGRPIVLDLTGESDLPSPPALLRVLAPAPIVAPRPIVIDLTGEPDLSSSPPRRPHTLGRSDCRAVLLDLSPVSSTSAWHRRTATVHLRQTCHPSSWQLYCRSTRTLRQLLLPRRRISCSSGPADPLRSLPSQLRLSLMPIVLPCCLQLLSTILVFPILLPRNRRHHRLVLSTVSLFWLVVESP